MSEEFTERINRREFGKIAAALGAGAFGVGAPVFAAATPAKRIRHACIGIGGMGNGDFLQIAGHPSVDIVAVCDIDEARGGKVRAKVPDAKFPYAARSTEMVLMGTIALRFPGRELAWDADAMRFPEVADANRFVRRNYRKGWEVEGL